VLRSGAENSAKEEQTCMMRGSSLVTNSDLVQHVDKLVRERHRFTTSELSLESHQVSRRTVLYEIVTEKLGYHKFCARWVLSSKAATSNTKTLV
jgi:hypothetical protein